MKNTGNIEISIMTIAIFLALVMSIASVPVQATQSFSFSPPIQTGLGPSASNTIKTVYSLNWAGYAVNSSVAGSGTDGKGSFVIASVSLSLSHAFGAFWA